MQRGVRAQRTAFPENYSYRQIYKQYNAANSPSTSIFQGIARDGQ